MSLELKHKDIALKNTAYYHTLGISRSREEYKKYTTAYYTVQYLVFRFSLSFSSMLHHDFLYLVPKQWVFVHLQFQKSVDNYC